LLNETEGFGAVDTLLIPELLRQLFAIQNLNLVGTAENKIEILSLIEARFTDADLVIMSGLNEGDFPQISSDGDLLNQQMRRQLGLDLPERKIGQQAHDFELLSQAPRVVYTRAKKDAGAPTVPSRFLQALTSLIALENSEKYQGWLAEFRAAKVTIPCAQPRPTPPLAARPQKLAVTQIEKLMRDPYMVYADKILGLRKVDDIDAEITPADFGNFVHKAIEKYNAVYDGTVQKMLDCAEEVLHAEYQNRSVLRVFWLPRFGKIAAWVVLKEREARKAGRSILVEYKAELQLGDFCLHARADRLEVGAEGVKIIDYKTGAVPSAAQVVKGIAPQISLEAVIFSRHFAKQIETCEFWQTKGRDDDKITVLKTDIEVLIAEAEEGVQRLINLFNDPKTSYIARPRPNFALAYNDYAHLARIQEWE
jgi:ATP-dependent helicase/nuclease subunit B